MNLSRLPVDVAAQVLDFDGRLRWDGRRGKWQWPRTNLVLDRVLSRVAEVVMKFEIYDRATDRITKRSWAITKTWQVGISTECAKLYIESWYDFPDGKLHTYNTNYSFYIESITEPEYGDDYCPGDRHNITPKFFTDCWDLKDNYSEEYYAFDDDDDDYAN